MAQDAHLLVKDETLTQFFNPSDKDFEMDILDDKNQTVHYVLPALKINEQPAYLAKILGKHLLDFVANQRKSNLGDPQTKAELEKEIWI